MLQVLALTAAFFAPIEPAAPTRAIVVPPAARVARDTKLVRYPTYHQGRVAFTYLGDIWIADETGKNLQRLTVNTARDVQPRFSPDGKWLAFSSDREGNDDVYIMAATGGEAKQLTHHSAADQVLGWTPDGKSVVFASNRGDDFTGKIYTVSVDGGMPKTVGVDYGVAGTYSPDGKKFAYNRRGQVYWRKFYRGANNSDVTVMEVATKKFTDLTNFAGEDSWPLYANDGWVYFVSDRDGNGLTNIWRVSDKGGEAEKITKFSSGDVRWPSISADRKTIVFEHDFGIWKLDLATGQTTPIRVEIDAETQANMSEVRTFTSEADEYDLAPMGRRVAVALHGEIFTVPADENGGGELTQITDSPWRDQTPAYSADGKWLAYISDESGREEIWVKAVDGSGAARKLTDVDALKSGFSWSPDSKWIAFASTDAKLRVVAADGGRATELSASRFGNIGAPVWSPDGKWIAFTKPDFTRTADVYLVPSAGGEEHRVTWESFGENAPSFSPDGKKLYFVRGTGGGGRGGPGGNANTQVWAITLDREAQDPAEATEGGGGRGAEAADVVSRETKIEWTGLKRRTRQFTRMAFGVQSYTVAPNGALAVLTNEPNGTRTAPTLYTVSPDGRRTTRVAALASGSTGDGDDNPPDPPPGGGRGGGAGNLNFTRDSRTVFYRQGEGVYSIPVAGNAGAGAAAPANAPAGRGAATGGGRRVTYSVRVKVDKPNEWKQMFGDAWRTMKYRFYDPKMHGKDWDAAKAKYAALLPHVGDRQELINIINEMIGELDASHTGAALGGGRGGVGGIQTRHLGFEMVPDDAAGRYKVTHVYEDGPADRDWVKVGVGDYLLAIDGTQVKAGDEYYQLLNHPLNRKVELTLNSKPVAEGAWKTKVEPVSPVQYGTLRYERWVKDRRAEVDKASSGRIGYVHIRAMDQPSLERFEKELRENRDKEALIIDQRWNGGGNIEQELLALLERRQYQVWQPRGTEPTTRPLQGFFGPKVVLQNWRSASNAEMFPAGFRALGLGKTIGNPTTGAVIGTGSYTLIDGATVRTPGTGVFLNDEKQTNMERYGVPPDIFVENTPEDVLAGRDRQLERAVDELKKQIGDKKKIADRVVPQEQR